MRPATCRCVEVPLPDTLMEPSMEAGQPPDRAAAASGWICPRCGIAWGPRVKRCTCEPGSTEARVEIHEN